MPTKLATGALAAGCALLWAVPCGAVEDQSGRFTMQPTDGGFVRLDRDTGAMSICTGKDGDWACKPMPDRQQALEARISALEAENRSLRAERSAPETPPPVTEAPPPAGEPPAAAEEPPSPPSNLTIPSDEDVDRVFDYVEHMVKKLKQRIKRLEDEAQKEETPL